jgi:hypothetical protein
LGKPPEALNVNGVVGRLFLVFLAVATAAPAGCAPPTAEVTSPSFMTDSNLLRTPVEVEASIIEIIQDDFRYRTDASVFAQEKLVDRLRRPGMRRNLMPFVTVQPEILAAAAGNLQDIGAGVSAQSAVACAPTTGVVPAAADEVSALTAARFNAHAQTYQTLGAQAALIHESFVATLAASADSYAATEAANAAAAG